MHKPGTRPALIIEYLQRHYPCQEIPHGDLADIAARFGVSRERVRQLKAEVGMGVVVVGPPPPLSCECGRPRIKHRTYCEECRFIPVACFICGKVKQIDRGTRAGHGQWRALRKGNHSICSRSGPCQSAFVSLMRKAEWANGRAAKA